MAMPMAIQVRQEFRWICAKRTELCRHMPWPIDDIMRQLPDNCKMRCDLNLLGRVAILFDAMHCMAQGLSD